MKKSILLVLGIIILVSCQNDDDDDFINQLGEVCEFKTEILSPEGFDVNTVGDIDFNGTVQSFQFINEQIGYAMATNNVGGYVEIFKTIDGGLSWDNLEIGIDHYPRSMIFRDENFGIVTVHDVTGCPPPNCQNKCVILKTVNGGLDWEEVELVEFTGILYHPKYDNNGNLYAYTSLGNQSVLVKSIDNGENWDTLFSSSELGFSLVTFSFEIYHDKIFISGKNGKLFVVNTNGELLKTIETEDSAIWDLEIVDEENIIVVISGKVIKSTDGGETWETIYEESARMIGFDSIDKGLMLLKKSSCPTDVYQVNDLIASTNNGGVNWIEAEETTTNLRIRFSNSQKINQGTWLVMIRNKLIEIKER